jgi:hypothetical protein
LRHRFLVPDAFEHGFIAAARAIEAFRYRVLAADRNRIGRAEALREVEARRMAAEDRNAVRAEALGGEHAA